MRGPRRTRRREGAGGTARAMGAALLVAALAALFTTACAAERATRARPQGAAFTPTPAQVAFLDTLEHRTFQWFWELSDPRTGLTPDRAPTRSFVSVSATGFALTAYPIGVERHWVSRAAARARVLATLRFFWTAPQDTAAAGAMG